MTIQQLLFILFAAIVLAGAVMCVTTKNLFHAALFLILSFFGVAGFYVLLEAGFFAVAQILVYIGAISILVIFAVMLTRGMQAMIPRNAQAETAAGVALVIFALLVAMFWGNTLLTWNGRTIGGIPWAYAGEANNIRPVPASSIADFGRALTSTEAYAAPFELASVLILLALIGAIWVARERRPAEILAERAEIAAEEAAEIELPRQEKLPLPETAPAHSVHVESH